MRCALCLLFMLPLLARGGTPYVLINKSLSAHAKSASYAQYYVSDGKLRAASFDSRLVYLFMGARLYVIDNGTKSIQVVTSALVDQGAARMDDRVKLIMDAAAKLPPDRRAVMERLAADMKTINDDRRMPVPRTYRVTDRSETVDGRGCRIWEGFEREMKRFEICVAPVAQIPGGTEILAGMKLLSTYWQGSIFALGVSLGNAGWWAGVESLGGLPILVREFKNGDAVSETTLAAIGDGVPNAPMFDLPAGYAVSEVESIP